MPSILGDLASAGLFSIAEALNMGRATGFEAIKDEIAAYQFSAILDARTCPVCADLNGRYFDADDPAVDRLRPPLHAGCRCIFAAVLKDEWKEHPEPTERYDPEDISDMTKGKYWEKGLPSVPVEAVKWQPTMGKETAEEWGKASVVKENVYHGTNSAAQIRKNGFKVRLKPENFGRPLGDGIYFEIGDRKIAKEYGTELLTCKINVKRIFEWEKGIKAYGGKEVFMEKIADFAKMSGLENGSFGAKLTAFLKSEGFDAVRSKSQIILCVFDPKSIVILQTPK